MIIFTRKDLIASHRHCDNDYRLFGCAQASPLSQRDSNIDRAYFLAYRTGRQRCVSFILCK